MVVDDDPAVRGALRLVFTDEAYELVEAEDGDSGLVQFAAARPDLVVLDVQLPGLDGFSVCQRIRSCSSVPILMLSGRSAVADKVFGLQHGADDYLGKPFAVEELIARCKALLRRSAAPAPSVLTFGDLVLDPASHVVMRGQAHVQLTAHEFLLLQLLMENPRQALTRGQLRQQAWGHKVERKSNVIDATIKDVRRKLEAEGGSRLVQTVHGLGYALREGAYAA